MCSKQKKDVGFTLIEVMVAITIFAISAIVIINLFSKSINSIADIRNYTIGLILAQSKMAEIQSGMETELEGIFEEGDVEYEWSVQTNETQFERIEEIQLKVLWEGRKRWKSIELIGYRLIADCESQILDLKDE